MPTADQYYRDHPDERPDVAELLTQPPAHKPILCLDFDGVCHSYTSGWQGAAVIADPPVAGLFEFLEQAVAVFDVEVFSSRSHEAGAEDAMLSWFMAHYDHWRRATGREFALALRFPVHKPQAMVTLDDRAVTFTGVWPDVAELRAFQPWHKRTSEPHALDAE